MVSMLLVLGRWQSTLDQEEMNARYHHGFIAVR